MTGEARRLSIYRSSMHRSPKKTDQERSPIFGYVGIRPGDLLISVNGVRDQTMMNSLVDGYERGNVCVMFERDKMTHEICLRKQTANLISAAPVTSQSIISTETQSEPQLSRVDGLEKERMVPLTDKDRGEFLGYIKAAKRGNLSPKAFDSENQLGTVRPLPPE